MRRELRHITKVFLTRNYCSLRKYACLALFFIISACGVSVERDAPPQRSIDVSSIPDAVPKTESRSRYGNPPSYAVNGKRYYVMQTSTGFVQRGIASWYGKKFHGRRTSSGETYDMYAMTAAHKSLPLPTYVEVINLENYRKIIVKVNDRGPFHANRIIDLSYSAAAKLGILAKGTGLVEVRAIDPKTYRSTAVPVKVKQDNNGVKKFYIQAGSFLQLANAEHLRRKLGVVGKHLVRINQAIVSGRTVYRVQIGPIVHVDDADRIATLLTQLGINDHHFVIE